MDQEQSLNLSLDKDAIIRRVFWTLLGIELFIVFLDVFVNHYKWISIGATRRMVNITREDSLSNWFSSLHLVAVGRLSSGLTPLLLESRYKILMLKGSSLVGQVIAVSFYLHGD